MTQAVSEMPRAARSQPGQSISEDLSRLGVSRGDILLVHASLRRLGLVVGGAGTVVQAMLDVLGPGGTLVVPTFTADNSDPSRWALTCRTSVPPESWPLIRGRMPAFDPDLTPSTNMGAIAETVRTWPGAVRSGHPQTSFAAVGADAAALMATHPWDCHLGPPSPMGALRRAGAKVLLLGVSFTVCSVFHLAEYVVPGIAQREYECVVKGEHGRTWYRYRDVALDDSDFERLGSAFESSASGAAIRRGVVGEADSRLFPAARAAAFAAGWIAGNR